MTEAFTLSHLLQVGTLSANFCTVGALEVQLLHV